MGLGSVAVETVVRGTGRQSFVDLHNDPRTRLA